MKGAAKLITHGVAWVINEEMDANVAKLGHHAHAEFTEHPAFIEGLARLGDAMLTFHAHSCAQLLSVEARRAAIIEANIAAADKRNLLGRTRSDDGLVERQEPAVRDCMLTHALTLLATASDPALLSALLALGSVVRITDGKTPGHPRRSRASRKPCLSWRWR